MAELHLLRAFTRVILDNSWHTQVMGEDMQRCLDMLEENVGEVRKNAENALLAICQNILSHPDDMQYREVHLDDTVVAEKLLPAIGAMECLFDVGFTEASNCLLLPQDASLSKLHALCSSLSKNSSPKTNVNDKPVNYHLSPGTSAPQKKNFLVQIMKGFQAVMRYEDPALQEKARKLIPIVELEIATMSRVRELQKRIKQNGANLDKHTKGPLNETAFDSKELFLLELLHWFKHKFFTWVDSLRCSQCFSSCEHHTVVPSNDPRCSRIEIHRCTNCKAFVEFPRYSDPEPLLKLRRGRCGEWANVFTLFCRSLGYDARWVNDQTDHIWTEVWSAFENRWIHVDPCEAVMDRPLMYEKGWKKQLTYIIAYSKDEVQDVTWRYTRDQPGVMKRRNLCSENSLLELIRSLNRQRQCSSGYNASRRQYVTKRALLELVELIRMPEELNSGDGESYEERLSGSYEWRLGRGEVSQASSKTNYSWDISKYGPTFHVHYSIVKDIYRIVNDDGSILEEISGWQNGANDIKNGIFRKAESDWKMVYLARSPGTNSGQLKWTFVVANPNFCVAAFDLQAAVTAFHGASIQWQIEAIFDDTDSTKTLVFPIDDCSNYHTDKLKGAVKLILTALLSGGNGDLAWQHAQLFRQSLENTEDRSLTVNIRLESR